MSTQTPPPPPGAPGYNPNPPSASAQQGMPTWAKIGIGCGCLALIIAVVGFALLGWGMKKVAENLSDPAAIAEFILERNPDLEVIENDPDSGRITIRQKSTGETQTFDYSDIQNGNFTFEGSDGEKIEVGGDTGGVRVTDSEGQETTYKAETDDSGGVRITTDEGEMRIGTNASAPSWVPQHPDADFSAGGMSAVSDGKAQGTVNAENVSASLEDLEAWYQEELSKTGCTVERSAFEMGQSKTVMLTCNQDETQLNVAMNEEADTRRLSVTYSGPAQ